MTSRKTDDEIKRTLLADAANPDAWEGVAMVPPSTSRRPSWYGKSGSIRKDARFDDAYRHHSGRLIRYFTDVLRFPDESARDLAQETLFRFYANLHSYRGDAEWAFMESIARNVAVNRARAADSAKRTAQVVSIADARARRQAVVDPDVLHRIQLHDAIAALPAGQRQAIQLWLDGFQYVEIARALGVTVAAVNSRLRDAKRHLRENVADLERHRSRRTP